MKTTLFKTALGFFIVLNTGLISAQNWVTVGNSDFPYTQHSTLALDSNDVPYIFYKNYFDGNTGFVMKFENDSWNSVGEEGFSETIYPGSGSNVAWKTHTLVIDNNDIPFVTYANIEGKLVIKKFENNQWQTVGGETVSQASATAISLAFDNNNAPYLSYMDWNNNTLVVKRLENNNWVVVGEAISSSLAAARTAITFDSNNNLFIAYSGMTGMWDPITIRIKKLEDNNWQDVGESISTNQDNNFDIAFVLDNQDTPYIVYNQSLNTILIRKFEENSWQTIGEIESSDNDHLFTSFAFDHSDTPYISYTIIDNNSDITTAVKKYEDNDWQTVGVTNQLNEASSITFDSNNIPYAVFTATGSTTIRKFDPTAGLETSVFNKVEMYPNPASQSVTLINLTENTAIRITDLTGKLIYSTKAVGASLTIDTTSFTSGLYLVELMGYEGNVVKKLVVK